jgi:hypothetical protein
MSNSIFSILDKTTESFLNSNFITLLNEPSNLNFQILSVTLTTLVWLGINAENAFDPSFLFFLKGEAAQKVIDAIAKKNSQDPLYNSFFVSNEKEFIKFYEQNPDSKTLSSLMYIAIALNDDKKFKMLLDIITTSNDFFKNQENLDLLFPVFIYAFNNANSLICEAILKTNVFYKFPTLMQAGFLYTIVSNIINFVKFDQNQDNRDILNMISPLFTKDNTFHESLSNAITKQKFLGISGINK